MAAGVDRYGKEDDNMKILNIRQATQSDTAVLAQHDNHIPTTVLSEKIARGEMIVAYENNNFVGWLRYGLFWDSIPFMNMLCLLPKYQRQGLGRQIVQFWEAQMKAQGHKHVLTSTLQEEQAQHFYTTLGYKSVGGFFPPDDSYELIFSKTLEEKCNPNS